MSRWGWPCNRRGLRFFSASVDMRKLLQAEGAQAVLSGKRSTLGGVWQAFREWQPAIERVQERMWQASQQAQAIIFSTLGMGAYQLAEKWRVPCFWALTFPMFGRTRTQPNPLLPAFALRGVQCDDSYPC
jgi:hypothetical protein